MWDNPRIINRISSFLIVLSVAGLVVGLFSVISQLEEFEIKKIIVKGELHEDTKKYLQHAIRDQLTGGFFTISLSNSKKILEQIPRVRAVNINRKWPNVLVINVVEHTPLARWGENKFVNNTGQIIEATASKRKPDNLPFFEGPDNIASEIANFYLRGNRILESSGREIVSIKVNNRYAWQVKLDNEIVLSIGKEKHLRRLMMFVKLYKFAEAASDKKINYLDMRYEDGFAVGTTS